MHIQDRASHLALPPALETAVSRLGRVPGVVALVLGGSRARGCHVPGSDWDLGLYFESDRAIDPVDIKAVLHDLVDAGTSCEPTAVGEWGPWIVGGGWFSIGGEKVDILYRKIDDVAQSIGECSRGDVSVHYQPGHPHGILSSLWMGEIDICHPLFDPHGAIAALKARTRPFPAALRKAIIGKFVWEIGFSIGLAKKAVARGDVSYINGCVFRAFSCLVQVLFAANEQYLINEKGALASASAFPHTVHDLINRTDRIWFAIGEGRFQYALGELAEIETEIQGLVAEA